MTRSPSEDRSTEGVDGPHYELAVVCAAPGCGDHRALQRHHMWRRSDVGGDKWWVRTSDGLVHGNCIKLCGFHHREITDNIARIVYANAQFWWKDVLGQPIPLDWQPPCDLDQTEAEMLADTLAPGHVHVPGDVCPTCLRKLPKPKDESEPEEKKIRKTWSVVVPVARLEDGAEVLDTLLREAHAELNRLGLPYGEGKKVNYYILATALGLFVEHADSIMSDG